jgi:hypothetical protein
MEDYLEAIFQSDEDKKAVRVKDIAKRVDVKMPSLSSMLKTLNNRGLVNYEKYEYVELTETSHVPNAVMTPQWKYTSGPLKLKKIYRFTSRSKKFFLILIYYSAITNPEENIWQLFNMNYFFLNTIYLS